ncbi:MAG: hypothetical protein L7S64_08885, partial [Longimicrobiales bacterium]|nr:hypothetical protein [Longimicrobiales bacterium]
LLSPSRAPRGFPIDPSIAARATDAQRADPRAPRGTVQRPQGRRTATASGANGPIRLREELRTVWATEVFFHFWVEARPRGPGQKTPPEVIPPEEPGGVERRGARKRLEQGP